MASELEAHVLVSRKALAVLYDRYRDGDTTADDESDKALREIEMALLHGDPGLDGYDPHLFDGEADG